MEWLEALFWVGLTTFGTGLYFLIDKGRKHVVAWIVTLAGVAGIAYAIYKHYHHATIGVPLWFYILCLTWVVIALDVYDRHFKKARAVTTDKLVIHSALYGTGPLNDRDVTEALEHTMRDGLVIPVDNNFLGCDPAPNQPKRIEVEYSYGTRTRFKVSRSERSRLVLPEDSEISVLNNGLQIVQDAARSSTDVQQRLQDALAECDSKYRAAIWNSETVQNQAQALAALPTYRHDLEAEISALYVGTTVVGPTTVFMLLKTWARRDLNLVDVKAVISLADGRYEARVLRDLSQWFLREEFFDHRFKMQNTKEVDLQDSSLSLIKEIESGIFREGHHPAKWIGCAIEDHSFIREEDVLSVKISFLDKIGIAKMVRFVPPWPATSYKVIDVEFRRQ